MSAVPKPDVLPADIWEHLLYDAETGLFWWIKPRHKRNMGKPAGSKNGYGYSRVCFNGRAYMAHRLAWAAMTGDLPTSEIDHINRDRSDNRFCNLRKATRLENCRNRDAAVKSRSRSVGVRECGTRWRAEITYGGRKRLIGVFDTVEEASAARERVAREVFGEFAP